MTGRACPECGTQGDTDGRSGPDRGRGCSCTEATGPQHYDPLRIRPYVSLPPLHQGDPAAPDAEPPAEDGFRPPSAGPADPTTPAGGPDAAYGPGAYGVGGYGADAHSVGGYGADVNGVGGYGASAGDATAPLPVVGTPPAGAPATCEPYAPYGSSTHGDVETTAPLPAAAPPEQAYDRGTPGGTSAPLPAAVSPEAAYAPAHEIRDTDPAAAYTYEVVRDDDGVNGRRRRTEEGGRRRGVGMLVAAASVIAVLGTAAFAAGLLTGGDDGKDRAAPDLESPAPFLSAAPNTRSPSSVSPTARASSTGSKATATSVAAASTNGSGPASPSLTARATASRVSSRTPSASAEAPTGLGPGDSGPDVFELQARLDQVWLYDGPYHGRYDDRVESAVADFQASRGIDGDPQGFYGPETRAALEAETDDPYSGQGGKHGGRGH